MYGSEKGEQEKQAIQKRVGKIVSQVAQAREMTGTFIELGGAKAFDKDKDPKKALRLGFAATGRPTQFIQLGGDDIANRVKSGFLDLLRQLGVLPDLSSLPTEGLPKPLNYLGIWLINKHGKPVIPVMIHIVASDGQLRATAPGLNGWVSYRDLLAAVAQDKVESYLYNEQARVVNFIQEQLEGDVLALGNTLLLCHAQNLRSTWKWLQDGKITLDQIAFGGEPPQPISDPAWQGLRIIRVRSNRDHETPQWYAQDGDQQGFSQGLFQIGERVFASTYQKPVAMKKLSPSLSRTKTVTSATDKVYEPAPNMYAWNPAIYELTVACLQPGDDPVAWATLAHMLRGISIHYNDPTALPLPLHLAKQVEEYA